MEYNYDYDKVRIPRFAKEYANFQKQSLRKEPYMADEARAYGLKRIDLVLRYYQYGLISNEK